MATMPLCPKCGSDLTYSDGQLFHCPICGRAWTQEEMDAAEEAQKVRDAYGNEITEGASGSVTEDLRLSGSERIKQGAKVSNIRILEIPMNDHDIECQVEGHGRMYLKSQYIKVN